MWGNRCDLSISAGKEIKPSSDPFAVIDELDPFILVNRCQPIWECLRDIIQQKPDTITIDIVQDNSGYELFTDIVLATFMLKYKLATKVRFYVKAIPWFISDVMPADFHWSVQQLSAHSNVHLAALGRSMGDHLAAGTIELCPVEYFWTGPWEFHQMADVRPKLYQKLAESQLVLFKGDLNYRKLLGDFNWPFGTAFTVALTGTIYAN